LKRILAFAFFLLFLAGVALVNLKGLERPTENGAPEAGMEQPE
jgi:hypothetical protein